METAYGWLKDQKDHQKMYEFFKDSPALQWIEADARADERKKADQRVLEERKKAQQQLLEKDKKAQQQLLEEQKKTLAAFRETVIALVAQRFPTLKRLVKAQVRMLK